MGRQYFCTYTFCVVYSRNVWTLSATHWLRNTAFKLRCMQYRVYSHFFDGVELVDQPLNDPGIRLKRLGRSFGVSRLPIFNDQRQRFLDDQILVVFHRNRLVERHVSFANVRTPFVVACWGRWIGFFVSDPSFQYSLTLRKDGREKSIFKLFACFQAFNGLINNAVLKFY